MTDNLKLAVVRGNVAAMKNLILEIEKTLELDEADLSNATPEKNAKCLRCIYGGLSGIQVHIDALKYLADASFCIWRAD